MKSIAQTRRVGSERAAVLQSSSEKNIADATQFLHDLSYSGTNKLKESCNHLKEEQSLIQTKVLDVAKKVDDITAKTINLNKDIQKVEKQAKMMPHLMHWIFTTTNQIASIKHQAKFIDKSLDSKSQSNSVVNMRSPTRHGNPTTITSSPSPSPSSSSSLPSVVSPEPSHTTTNTPTTPTAPPASLLDGTDSTLTHTTPSTSATSDMSSNCPHSDTSSFPNQSADASPMTAARKKSTLTSHISDDYMSCPGKETGERKYNPSDMDFEVSEKIQPIGNERDNTQPIAK